MGIVQTGKLKMRIFLCLSLITLCRGAPQSYSDSQTGALDAGSLETIAEIFGTQGKQVDDGYGTQQQTGELSDDVDVLVQVIKEDNSYPNDYVPESAQQVVDKATVEVNTDFENCADYTELLGYECVPYYQCHNGTIITDGAGLIDIRNGFGSLTPEDSKCPGFLDVCCKDPDFIPPPPPKIKYAPSGKWDKNSVTHLEAQANVLARKEFGYLDSWEAYPEFTTKGTTVIFVRHPFERILSAFRDKLEDPSVKGGKFNEYYYNKYGRRIVMHYRKEKITGPSFKYPRFSEFLNYLLDKDLRFDDEHWAPFYKECAPCHINYTFIGHFETLYWDMHLLANKANIVDKWDDKNDYFQSSTYLAVSKEYYGGVDRDVIRKLYKRYKIDFELFGYSPEEYIKMGKPGPDDVIQEIREENKLGDDDDKENKVQDEVVNPEDIMISGLQAKDELVKPNEGLEKEEIQVLLTEENLLVANSNIDQKVK